ncbi:TatD family hydrolase [Acuticoccus sp. MNP-M23]|uniref:TatD family hydrolase n=1 Tax=Acuticoccus sp. MNP-M23 TaxID=3072793 RepID=UPI0028156F5A|nr:TatD family hydrolase [Acuticoccus sp. MNP-M23]WMS42189.1 TatD family hydrolase [Acuticoccus sp. MNP-M23]
MRLVDSHCHLDFPDFDAERDAVLDRARARGVERFVTISTRVRQFHKLAPIIAAHDDVYASIGTHPHNAHEELDISVADLVKLAEQPKVVAIGEAGLDYHYDKSPRDAQAEGFRNHIAAARETGLPLVIHARQADEDVADILEDEMGKGAFPAILHCFSSGAELARRGLALGLYVSFSGIVTFRSAESIREVARTVPLDRMLVETDAPYLAPQPHRGKTNEPSFVADTAAILAEAIDVPLEQLAAATTQNFYRLFTKVKAPAVAQ